jgi:hypothetical protein
MDNGPSQPEGEAQPEEPEESGESETTEEPESEEQAEDLVEEPEDLGLPKAGDIGRPAELGPIEARILAPVRGRLFSGRIVHPAEGRRRWDLSRSRERTRGALALCSMFLFVAMVAALTIPVISGRKWEDLQGLATSVLPVVVSVVGTTTGFYFGTKSGGEEGK